MPKENCLTAEQELCLRAASAGHNFLILGEAGTGKSTVIVDIFCQFHRGGKKFQVLCSTGIACEVFEDRLPAYQKPITINFFLGIGTAEGPFNNVISKACRNENVERRIREIRSIVFDECSMGSSQLLELFHATTATLRGSNKLFGGIQVIAVGDFLQLKPVPSSFDDGAMMFHSKIFPKLFPHRIKLRVLYRKEKKVLRVH